MKSGLLTLKLDINCLMFTFLLKHYFSLLADGFLGGNMGGGLGMGTPPLSMNQSNLPPMSVSQPLPSNVLSKQQSNMDQQYMQQSSQIFVFSTQWANNAAKAVMNGSFQSIIGWHENQEETKKHLAVRFEHQYYYFQYFIYILYFSIFRMCLQSIQT